MYNIYPCYDKTSSIYTVHNLFLYFPTWSPRLLFPLRNRSHVYTFPTLSLSFTVNMTHAILCVSFVTVASDILYTVCKSMLLESKIAEQREEKKHETKNQPKSNGNKIYIWKIQEKIIKLLFSSLLFLCSLFGIQIKMKKSKKWSKKYVGQSMQREGADPHKAFVENVFSSTFKYFVCQKTFCDKEVFCCCYDLLPTLHVRSEFFTLCVLLCKEECVFIK